MTGRTTGILAVMLLGALVMTADQIVAQADLPFAEAPDHGL